MFDHPMYGRHLSPSIPEIERDHEDILMIQYPNNAQNNANSNNNAEARENRTVRDRDSQVGGGNMSISVANNGTAGNVSNEQPQNFLFNANFPIFDNENSEQGGNENSNSAQGAQSNSSNEPVAQPINSNAPPPNNHPLLSGRPDGNSDRAEDRIHDGTGGLPNIRRTGRARRYQFINLNSRNPPVILQRMLELRQNRQGHQATGNAAGNGSDPVLFRDGTRVVVMDNGISIFSNDDLDFEMLDQSGYWFGRTLANHLNNHPSALGWWQEENKISGPESNSDLCMIVCDEMIPELDSLRASELSKIRCNKRKKKSTDEDEIKQKNQEKKSNEEEPLVVQPELALSSALANVPVPVEPIRVADSNEEANQLNEDRSVETMQVLQIAECAVTTAQVTPANNLNTTSFVDETSGQSSGQSSQPITISTQVVEQPQQLTNDNQLNIMDFDFEMASDNDESSASANNSRSFSPNYSPNSNQIEAGGMNMLNRETSQNAEQQQLQPVNNLNILDEAAERRIMEDDHPMGNESDEASEEEFGQINERAEAAQNIGVCTPSDSDSDPELSNEDTDDEEEGAVGGIDNEGAEIVPAGEVVPPTQSDEAANTENENTANQEVAAGGIVTVQEMDPSVRAILGDLQVPEGIDPTFLAALPQEMRDEVIQEHLR